MNYSRFVTMKIALIQMAGAATNEENLKNAVSKINEAAQKGSDIVVLPEMFSCPYKASNFPVFAQKDGEENWKQLSEAAGKNKIYLAAGSMPEREGEKIFNTSYVFGRDGKQIAKHRKMHLFDCDIPGGAFFHESDTLTAGNKVTVFDTEYGKIGLMICFFIVDGYVFHFSFISRMPMTIQMISRTRQMILTKMPRAAERPRAAIESTKPPSWTPRCMGRKPMRLANSVVNDTMRMECR